MEFCRAELKPEIWKEENGQIKITVENAQMALQIGIEIGRKCW